MAVAGARVAHDARSVRLRVPASRAAQLLAASGFALAQPLFDLLGKNAEFFAAHGSTPGDILLFALVVTFVPALVLLAIEVVVGLLSEPAAYALHLVFVALFLFNTPVEHLLFPNAQARAATALVRHPTPIVFLLFDEFPVIDLQT